LTVESISNQSIFNHDWEDLAAGEDRKLYIGDFGNNHNSRHNLTIYVIEQDSSGNLENGMQPIITFRYPDQKEFPPPPTNWNYDCEAFFYYNDSLYLFSKNVSARNRGFTKMYRLSSEPGDYIAELIDSFNIGEPVTAADISSDGKIIVLLTYFSLLVFTDYSNSDFFKGNAYQIRLKGYTQKEGICFATGNQLFIADEKRFVTGGKIYALDLNLLSSSFKDGNRKKSIIKKAVYNLVNNPKRKYKEIMRSVSPQ
ncbi:MAG: hypothetical protein H0V61_06800, partial [Chitinophagales bacterium]|nr:hypothetical protein [Chitinophagales bacterium]